MGYFASQRVMYFSFTRLQFLQTKAGFGPLIYYGKLERIDQSILLALNLLRKLTIFSSVKHENFCFHQNLRGRLRRLVVFVSFHIRSVIQSWKYTGLKTLVTLVSLMSKGTRMTCQLELTLHCIVKYNQPCNLSSTTQILLTIVRQTI